MEESSEDDSSSKIVVREDSHLAFKILAKGFGPYHFSFIKSSANYGARVLLALAEDIPAGAVIGFTAFDMGVVYYIYVEERFRGLGVGKTLILSLEEIFESMGTKVFVASTVFSNKTSMRLFESLGYELIPIELLEEKSPVVAEKIKKVACMEDDDVLMVKPSLQELQRSLLKVNSKDVVKMWIAQCYKPWISYFSNSLKGLESPSIKLV
ncbi:MAG: GNAT family N-acetyltransferase [Acidilobaceae archaeon]